MEWLPGERIAMDACVELRRQVLSDELFLLAITRLRSDPPGRQVLEEHGITAEVVLANVRTGGDGATSPKHDVTYSPASYGLRGRAEAFAAALGDGTITPEHLLLALLWNATSHSSYLVEKLGVRREVLVDGLRARGVPVPAAPLPPHQWVPWGEKVWFDRDQVAAVTQHLAAVLPPGTQWGFNYEGDRAYAGAEASIDLRALVAEALPPAVEIFRLDHVQLAMPAGHEDQAAAFYEGLLGLPRVPKPERLAGRGGCWFEKGEVRVHLGVDPDFRPARKAHPALLVRGLPELIERLHAAGVPLTEDEGGSVYVEDPFGNRVELLGRSDTLLGPP